VASSLPITFLTDYGVADDFAGICRAVIARIAPDTQVIDISHGIGRHDVRQASAILADAVPYAPVAVHLAIVDPGVGGPRRAVAVETKGEGHLLVGPDNGLLPPAIDALGGAADAVDITRSAFRLEHPTATYHGRPSRARRGAHGRGRAHRPGQPRAPAGLAPAPRAASRLRPRRADRRLREHLARPLPRRPRRPSARRRRAGLGRLPQAPPDRDPRRRLRGRRRRRLPLLRGLLGPDGDRRQPR
jgi:hypothetical protein